MYDEDSEEDGRTERREAYKKGFLDGIAAFAHWKDGIQLVGTAGRKLKDMQAYPEWIWNFNPRSVE